MSTHRTLHLAALCAALLLSPAAAYADGDPTTDAVPRLLPYQGMLELDGRPVHATGDAALHLLFALYAAPDADQPVYQQPITVEVYSGRFIANIGPTGQGPDGGERAIVDVIAAADDLSLGITLLGDPADPTDDIPLQNRQRIHATPYAMWSTTATNLSVAARLDVAGDAQIGGALRVDGPVTITPGALADGTLRVGDLDPAMLGASLIRSGDTLEVDPAWLAGEIRTWVRGHCQVQLGWRDNCDNCALNPAKHIAARADATCGGALNGACRGGTWAGINTDGDVNDDDVFYIRMVCD